VPEKLRSDRPFAVVRGAPTVMDQVARCRLRLGRPRVPPLVNPPVACNLRLRPAGPDRPANPLARQS
jgi:hypothetical protein